MIQRGQGEGVGRDGEGREREMEEGWMGEGGVPVGKGKPLNSNIQRHM